jgi:uncharacterized protein YqjF (DUF2071 family)
MDRDDIESDRTWPLPDRNYAMRMGWHDLLFAHWATEPKNVDALLPNGIRGDTFDGRAWVALVPFRMSDVAPRRVPAIPWVSAFPELNVRTYVTLQGKPGVWFFSLDASNPLAVRVARTVFHLPYMDARMSLTARDEWFHYSSHRTHRNEPAADFVARYRPTGIPFRAQPGTFEYWLTARYCLYTADRKGRVLRGEIDHPPWTLQRAELDVTSNTMLDGLDIQNRDSPHLLFSRNLAVKAWSNERVTESYS